MDYNKLIERWRNLANRWENGEQLLLNGAMRIEDELRTAATALSTLQAENEKLRTRNTKLEDTVRSQRNGLQELRDQLKAYRNGHCAEGGCAAEKDRDEVLAKLERVTAELEVQKTKCDRCRFYPVEEDRQ